ncbi:hypothetical protein [Stenotrophomonas sp.]|uniref:hypothetical protein n=1 Tax=Stenotrophomonas sp. TaxID=69392 RepID=UPI0028A913CB|nr:hypothetical protein [Stenotrophomonas sp.]
MFTYLTRITRTALLALQALFLVGCSQASQPSVAVPGSVVSLAPPPGFAPAPNFSGFASEDGRASILVAELPADASAAVSGLFADEATARDRFASQGVQVERLESITSEGRTVPVVIGSQIAHGYTFGKWVALFSGSPTVIITIQAPSDHELTHKQAMRALASVKLGTQAALEQKVAALPFSVRTEPPFRLLDTLANSAMVLTAGELDTDPEGRQPLVIVASQLSLPFDSDDLAQVSDQLIAGTVRVQGGTIASRGNVNFGGIVGHRVDGLTPDGRRYRHYLALWPGERFVRMVAILPTDSTHDVLDAVDGMAASVRFRQ